MKAKDLSKTEPRPMDAKLEGYEWLPRMIDKARAYRAATLGDYYKYPCPIDRRCLERLDLDAEQFAGIATSSSNDGDVLVKLKEVGIPTANEAAFDPVDMNKQYHKKGGS